MSFLSHKKQRLLVNVYIRITERECQTEPESLVTLVKCDDGMQCINPYDICDGYTNCNDKSDEDKDMCKGKL